MAPGGRDRIVGVVLAGGKSRRMGGGDKALLPLAGQPLIAHVIARLAPQVGSLVINANGDPARFAAFPYPVAADATADFAGPLAGVLAGMQWARAQSPAASHIVTAAGDTPFLPHDLVESFAAATELLPDVIALAGSGSDLHPVFGLFPIALAEDLAAALAADIHKVLTWTGRHRTIAVDFPFIDAGDEPVDPFYNANTPEELARAEAFARVLAR